MFEATLDDCEMFRKVIMAISDLVSDANFDCTAEGIRLQAMDSSHVSLVNLLIKREAFSEYKCDNNHSLGVNFSNLNKVLKCSKPKDSLTLRHMDDSDVLELIFSDENCQRTLNFELKLMEIDQERLIIPDTDYNICVAMSSKEYQSLCRDLSTIGDSLTISCAKQAVKFSLVGDIGSGDITYKHTPDIDDIDDFDKNPNCVLIRNSSGTLSQSFAIRYLSFFTKATSLSKRVNLFMSEDVPLVAEYQIENSMGHLKYYLAPKVDDDN